MMSYEDGKKRLEAIVTEVDFWKMILDDARAICKHSEEAVDAVADGIVLPIELIMKFGTTTEATRISDRIFGMVHGVQTAIPLTLERAVNLIQLSEGRLKMLQEESREIVEELGLSKDDDNE